MCVYMARNCEQMYARPMCKRDTHRRDSDSKRKQYTQQENIDREKERKSECTEN